MTPGIWNAEQVAGWGKVTKAVHEAGGLIVSQLWHTGRVGHSSVRCGQLPKAPSAVAIAGQQVFTPEGPKDFETPQALTVEEIHGILDDYEQAARNAREAGFDGVELHGAFGYLPHQFLADSANLRTDQYGGSVENRARFVLEVMERLVGVWGPGRVGIRISPTIAYNGMGDSDPLATFTYLIGKLDQMPLAYLHLMRATPDPNAYPSWPQDTIGTFGPMFNGPLILNGGYDREEAETAIRGGAAAAVSFGSPFIANPDLVKRFELGAELAEGDRSTFYHGGEKGYIDYLALDQSGKSEPAGYWLVLATVTDPVQFGRYTEKAGPLIASYGGRVLARGEILEVAEGTLGKRPFLIEFPNLAAARDCFNSEGYQEAIRLRAGAAHFDIAILQGTKV